MSEAVKGKKEKNEKKKRSHTTLILSIVFAVILWFVVVAVINPETTVIVDNVPVTVNLEGLPAEQFGLSVVEGADQRVSVEVQGPRLVVSQLTAADFTVTPSNIGTVVSARQITTELNVTINDAQLASQLDLNNIRVIPQSISLTFAQMSEKTFPISYQVESAPGAGYYVGDVLLGDQEVVIRGLASAVDQVSEVKVIVEDLESLTDTTQRTLPLRLYDSNGEELPTTGLQMSISQTSVTIPILLVKQIGVRVQFTDVPSGLDIDRYASATISQGGREVQQVQVAGPREVVESLPDELVYSLSLSEVDQSQVQFEWDLALPSGVILVSGEEPTVQVEVTLTGIAFATFDVRNIQLESVLQDTVEVQSQRVREVRIAAPESVLETLTAEDLVAIVTKQNLDSAGVQGQFAVPVVVASPSRSDFWVVGKYTVNVNVRSA